MNVEEIITEKISAESKLQQVAQFIISEDFKKADKNIQEDAKEIQYVLALYIHTLNRLCNKLYDNTGRIFGDD